MIVDRTMSDTGVTDDWTRSDLTLQNLLRGGRLKSGC